VVVADLVPVDILGDVICEIADHRTFVEIEILGINAVRFGAGLIAVVAHPMRFQDFGDLLSFAGICEQQDVKVRGPVMMGLGDPETVHSNPSSVECGSGTLPLLIQPFHRRPHGELSVTRIWFTTSTLRMECARCCERDEYGGITALARDCLRAEEPHHELRAAIARIGDRGGYRICEGHFETTIIEDNRVSDRSAQQRQLLSAPPKTEIRNEGSTASPHQTAGAHRVLGDSTNANTKFPSSPASA
jgi:hypothetical protein